MVAAAVIFAAVSLVFRNSLKCVGVKGYRGVDLRLFAIILSPKVKSG